MTILATCDERERVRATRVEVARLQSVGYRVPLTEDEKATVRSLVQRHMMTLPLADRESIVDTELERANPTVDWSILDEPRVPQAIASAARNVARQYGSEKLSATTEDLIQAGRIIVAEKGTQARQELAKGYPFLQRWVWQRLVDLVKYEHRDTSLDALEDARERSEAIAELDDSSVDLIWKGEPYWKGKWR